jgi:hypothetical protein
MVSRASALPHRVLLSVDPNRLVLFAVALLIGAGLQTRTLPDETQSTS